MADDKPRHFPFGSSFGSVQDMRTPMLLLSAIIGASSLNEKREAASHPSFFTPRELHGFPSANGRVFYGGPGSPPIVPYPTDVINQYQIPEAPFPHWYEQNALHLEDDFHRFYHENIHVPRAIHHPIRPFHSDVKDIERFHNPRHPLARNPIFQSPPKRLLDILQHQKEFGGKYVRPSDQVYFPHTSRNLNDHLEPIKQIYGNPNVKVKGRRIPPSQVLIYNKPFRRLHHLLGHHHQHSGFTENENLLGPIGKLPHHADYSPDLNYLDYGLSRGLDTLPIEDLEVVSDNTFLRDIFKPYAQSEYAAIAVHPSGGTSFVKTRRIGKREAKLIPESEAFGNEVTEKNLKAKENLKDGFLPAEHRSLDDGFLDLPGTIPFDDQFGGLRGNEPVMGLQDKVNLASPSVINDSISSTIPALRPVLKHLTSSDTADVHTPDSKRSAASKENSQLFIPDKDHGQNPRGLISNSSYAFVPADDHVFVQEMDHGHDPRGRSLDSSYASIPTGDLVFNPQLDHRQSTGSIDDLDSTYASVPTEHPDDVKSYGLERDYVSGQIMNQVNNHDVKKSYRYDITHSIIAGITDTHLPEVHVQSRIELPKSDHISSSIPGHDVILSDEPLLNTFPANLNIYETGTTPLEEGLGIHQSLLRAGHSKDQASSYIGNYGIGPVNTVRKNFSLYKTAIPFLQDQAVQTIPYKKVSHDTPSSSLQGGAPSKKNIFNHIVKALQRKKTEGRPNTAYHVTKPYKNHRNSFPTPLAFHTPYLLNSGHSFPYSITPRLGYSTDQRLPRLQLLVHDGKSGILDTPFNIRKPFTRMSPRRIGLPIQTKGLTHHYKTPALGNKLKPGYSRRHHQREKIHRQNVRPIATAIPKRPYTKSKFALVNRQESRPISRKPSYKERIYNPYLYYGLY